MRVKVIFKNGDRPIMAPMVINAKTEAGVGYVCGVFLHFLPFVSAKNITFDVTPLRSANQFHHGVKVGYADKTVPAAIYNIPNVTTPVLKEKIEALAAEREPYLHYTAPASHFADNFASQKWNMGNLAENIGKLLTTHVNSREYKLQALQREANALLDKQKTLGAEPTAEEVAAMRGNPMGPEDFARNRANARRENAQALDSVMRNISSLQTNPDFSGDINYRRPMATGSGLMSEHYTISDIARELGCNDGSGAMNLLHNIHAAAMDAPHHIQRQVAGALKEVAAHSKKFIKPKQPIPLPKMFGKPRVITLRNGARIVLGNTMKMKRNLRYPLLPPQFINVGKRAAPLTNFLKPSTGIKGFLEHVMFGNNPKAQHEYIQQKADELNALDPGSKDFMTKLKKATKGLNSQGVKQLADLLKGKNKEDLDAKIKERQRTHPGKDAMEGVINEYNLFPAESKPFPTVPPPDPEAAKHQAAIDLAQEAMAYELGSQQLPYQHHIVFGQAKPPTITLPPVEQPRRPAFELGSPHYLNRRTGALKKNRPMNGPGREEILANRRHVVSSDEDEPIEVLPPQRPMFVAPVERPTEDVVQGDENTKGAEAPAAEQVQEDPDDFGQGWQPIGEVNVEEPVANDVPVVHPPTPGGESIIIPEAAMEDISSDDDDLTEPHDILGVSRDATPEEITRAYRKKAIRIHPDRNNSPRATQRFQKLGDAYSVLLNEAKEKLKEQAASQPFPSQSFYDRINKLQREADLLEQTLHRPERPRYQEISVEQARRMHIKPEGQKVSRTKWSYDPYGRRPKHDSERFADVPKVRVKKVHMDASGLGSNLKSLFASRAIMSTGRRHPLAGRMRMNHTRVSRYINRLANETGMHPQYQNELLKTLLYYKNE